MSQKEDDNLNEEYLTNNGFKVYNTYDDMLNIQDKIHEITSFIDNDNNVSYYLGIEKKKLTSRIREGNIYLCSRKKIIAYFKENEEYPILKPYHGGLNININFNSDKDIDEKLPLYNVRINESYKLRLIIKEYDNKFEKQQTEIDTYKKIIDVLSTRLTLVEKQMIELDKQQQNLKRKRIDYYYSSKSLKKRKRNK